MELVNTPLKGCFVIKPRIFEDTRGYFFETFNENVFHELTGQDPSFVQDNESYSIKGVLRGLHFQSGEAAQAKLVRVVKGEVLDVVVDLRVDSNTYGQHFSIILNDTNKSQLFVPRGFAHGFVVLSDFAIFNYKCDNFYNQSAERGIIYNDPVLNIDWKLPSNQLIISPKDLELPEFKNY